ncbi:LacI family DNA-binding transcriptional regulator [Leucobacter sp. CSA1]|uniref:LacI family DNA-binding transcriptional regulator n=1 Tax=Leucobacter chromiisoli TaxID=2796471 RepID=A0A934QAF7_9MICO|nr:LacI family DNA-binding transcriptional regulator [Leucobacter chromiisoli]
MARAAGVSPTTVSHALNGKGVVRRETEERIRQVAARIGYRPSAIARGLRNSRLGLLGLIIRPFDTLDSFIPAGVDYFLRIAGSASLTAMEHGYSLMMVDDPSKRGRPVSALAADGYVVTEPFENDPVLSLLERERIPFVAVGADIARRDEFVTMDTLADKQAVQMIEHLVSAGATRVALVVGTDRNAWNLDSRDAYLDWCARVGQDPLWIAIPEAQGERAGEIALDRFFGEGAADAPDAVYCLMGRQASGIARAAVARGISVPDELLVAAGSGALQNQTMHPTVTAFDLQPEVIAQRAVEAVIRLIEGEAVETPFEAPEALLHLRESTQRV